MKGLNISLFHTNYFKLLNMGYGKVLHRNIRVINVERIIKLKT